ncbi:ribonuclease HII [Spelaeicoccus albus]|uniref:Ribonuclease n=1 Tax=Spelaeicoccus albus TaxID=1280376 RepID=A0A7Z0IHR5_9MICO|nr:ribonuclease HII [Spelaeicoccus albus]NYI67747.1 ribonuclease HII [Spelaeicoccus albus]
MTGAQAPTLDVERELMRGGFRFIAGMDEVGRGALAGPVSVGVVMIDATCASVLPGVRDSKLLSAAQREALISDIEKWCVSSAVGHAGPADIDRMGITRALGLAGRRALAELDAVPDVVLLDGNADWLSGRGVQLGLAEAAESAGAADGDDGRLPPVRTRVKADLTSVTVGAASVLAKVCRDALMAGLAPEFPHFDWQLNKGYGTAAHRAMISRHGPCRHHRTSWRLPSSAGRDALPTAGEA